MNESIYKAALYLIAIAFTAIFCIVVIPPLIENPDVLGALMAGFVNPYSSGYSADVLCCWLILVVWIMYERPKVKYGWVCALIGFVPGVAVGFAGYLLLRHRQLKE